MDKNTIEKNFEKGRGIFQLKPTWVPRTFGKPGHRLRLHPDDYFAFGMDRGAICERWLGSVTVALNGPKTRLDEGMSYVTCDDGETFLLKDAIKVLGAEIIGDELFAKYGTWPTFAKFFDYDTPLFHHLHLSEEKANLIGKHGKPEAYYFPEQLNNVLGRFPVTYFGFDPDTNPDDIKDCIRNYENFDTRITEYSRAYRVKLGTGWYTPPGVIHAPASVLTYEPQWNSDVNTIMENVTMNEVNPINLLTSCTPEDKKNDVDYIFSQIDWENSTEVHYKEKYFREPKLIPSTQDGLIEKWVSYANDFVAAKEVTIAPKSKVILKDESCYCAIIVQGFGKFGEFDCETAVMLRADQLSGDEFFVSEGSANKGVCITNNSKYENLVILQNFANNNKSVPNKN